MVPLKRTLQYLLCVLTALQLCGGHLGVFQIVAWAQMLRDYSQEKGLVEGVKETFDGDHPCPMCCKINQAKQQQQKQTPLPLEKIEKISKWLGFLPTLELPAPAWSPLRSGHEFAAPSTLVDNWLNTPPTPPPRALA